MTEAEKLCIMILVVRTTALHIAGWSSLAARRAHNPKVVGSNPTPATKQVTLKFFLSVFLIHYVIDRRAISYNYFERRQKEE